MFQLVRPDTCAGATAKVTGSVACHPLLSLLPTSLVLNTLLGIHHPLQLVCLHACTGATAEEPGSAALYCGAPFPGYCGHFPLCAAHEGTGHAGSQRSHQVISAPNPSNPNCGPNLNNPIVTPQTMKHQLVDCHAYL